MGRDVVQAIRQFNRRYTPRVGVLEESFLGTGRPLAASRLLFEIGLGPVTVHEIRQRLDADSGYVSRLLRRLETDGLVELHDDPDDRRRRVAQLTDAGRIEWSELDQRSDEIARTLVDPLTDSQRERLAAALDTVGQLLRVSEIRLVDDDPGSDQSMAAMIAYVEELNHRFPDSFDIGTGFDSDELDLMRPPSGGFVIAVDSDDQVVGCGGLRSLDSERAEIKRMWIDPSVRGLGVGRRLLARLEELARELDHTAVVLDTNGTLNEAISMYRSSGYEDVERYNDNPYAELFFRKALKT